MYVPVGDDLIQASRPAVSGAVSLLQDPTLRASEVCASPLFLCEEVAGES